MNHRPENFSQGERPSWEEVRDLILLLVKTNSAFKIFPSEHITVKQFVLDFYERLKSFLEKENSLDLFIGENYFEFMNEKVYEDENVAHSLPFFFFRDGLQRLSFHRGLTENELYQFFETIKEVASRPAEEADIVSAFWEKNFENISFYAPDEFIIEKISAGRPIPEYEVNPEELFSGKIELTDEDRRAIEEWQVKSEGIEDSAEEKMPSAAEEELGLKEEEWKTVEAIIHSYRHLPHDEELARLMLEILYLEDRLEQLPSFKDSLHQAFKELLKAGKLVAATSFLRDLISLKKIFSSDVPQKTSLIDAFLAELEADDYLALVSEIYFKNTEAIKNETWLDFFEAVGQPALNYLATIYQTGHLQAASSLDEIALIVLEKWAQKKPQALMKLASESQPYFSQLIIKALARHPDRQIISFLASFIRSSKPQLRREALEALSLLESPAAQKIILGYIHDPSEEIRIAAIKALKVSDETGLDHLLKLASFNHLKKKTEREIEAILEALARTNHPRVRKYFQQLFGLRSFLRPKIKKMGELAIEALRRASNLQAKELLQELREKGRGKLKKYSDLVLKEINSKDRA